MSSAGQYMWWITLCKHSSLTSCGVKFHYPLRKLKIHKWLAANPPPPPPKHRFIIFRVFPFLFINTVRENHFFFYSAPSAPWTSWTSCTIPLRPVQAVEQFWSSYTTKGPSDAFCSWCDPTNLQNCELQTHKEQRMTEQPMAMAMCT